MPFYTTTQTDDSDYEYDPNAALTLFKAARENDVAGCEIYFGRVEPGLYQNNAEAMWQAARAKSYDAFEAMLAMRAAPESMLNDRDTDFDIGTTWNDLKDMAATDERLQKALDDYNALQADLFGYDGWYKKMLDFVPPAQGVGAFLPRYYEIPAEIKEMRQRQEANRVEKISDRYVSGILGLPAALIGVCTYRKVHDGMVHINKEKKAAAVEAAQGRIASFEKARSKDKTDTVSIVSASTTYMFPHDGTQVTVLDKVGKTTYSRLIAGQQQIIADNQKPLSGGEAMFVAAYAGMATMCVWLQSCFWAKKFIANMADMLTETFHAPKTAAPKPKPGE